MSLLRANELRKSYPTPDGELVIFDRLSMELAAGEAMAIVGPSGCGKSTLLHCLGTLDPPTAGTVVVDGVNPYELTAANLATFRNHRIGFVFQDHFLMPQLTALQNVLVPVLAAGAISKVHNDRAQLLLEKVGLGQRLDHLPSQLSGGERARVAIARSLVNHPALLLADEPTGSLDPKTAETIADLLLTIQSQENVAMLIVTHSVDLAARLPRQLRLAVHSA